MIHLYSFSCYNSKILSFATKVMKKSKKILVGYGFISFCYQFTIFALVSIGNMQQNKNTTPLF